MVDHHDDMLDADLARVAASLREMPEVEPSAVARVLVAAAASERQQRRLSHVRSRGLRWAGAAAVAAGIVAAFALTRPSRPDEVAGRPPIAAPPAAGAGTSAATLAAASGEPTAVAVQLVMRAPGARHMAVVGDFTGWDDGRIPMQRDPSSGLWSATVTVRPGRHVYAFVADDTVWMRDPAAPRVHDADFGRPGSLLLVGKP